MLSESILTLCMRGNFSCFCCRILIFFQKLCFPKIISGKLSECQRVWIQIRTDILSVLIWVKTACKGYQSTKKLQLETRELILIFKQLYITCMGPMFPELFWFVYVSAHATKYGVLVIPQKYQPETLLSAKGL